LAKPVVLEPILGIEVRVPQDLVGNVASVISGKRGKVLDMQQKGILSIVIGEVPASETFDLSQAMRGQTAGKAIWNTFFKSWSPIPKSIVGELVPEIRKRKGLSPEPPKANELSTKSKSCVIVNHLTIIFTKLLNSNSDNGGIFITSMFSLT